MLPGLNTNFLMSEPGLSIAARPQRIGIVIADSQALFRDALRTLISTEPDFDVLAEAGHADTILQAVAVCQPDILLLTLPLEDSDGERILEVLRTSHPETKVIVMAVSAGRDEHVKSIKLGSRGIVPKSASGAMLVKAIRKVQGGEFWMDRNTTAEVVRQFTDGRTHELSRTQLQDNEPKERHVKPSVLSKREREIVNLVTQGYRNKELAERLIISEQTVKNHMHNIFEKLGVSDRLELALYSIHHNLREVD